MQYSVIYEITAKTDIVTAMNTFKDVIEAEGKIVKFEVNGYIKAKVKYYWGSFNSKLELFMKEIGGLTYIRAGADGDWDSRLDSIWDRILLGLKKSIEIDAIPGKPFIIGAIQRTGDVEQKTSGTASRGISPGGMLIGGALGGTWGAVLGGSMGKRKINTRTETVMANSILYTLKYSNGKIKDKYVSRNFKEYNEIVIAQK